METSACWGYLSYLLIFGILLEKGDAGRSIKCYACESKKDEQCADTFKSTGARMMDCTGSCIKSNNRYKEHVTYSRYCANETVADNCTTTDYDTGSHVKCFCSTSYCNGDTIAKPDCLIVLVPIVLLCAILSTKT